jgi:hypothetical protein
MDLSEDSCAYDDNITDDEKQNLNYLKKMVL